MKINNLKILSHIFKFFFYFRKFVMGYIEYLHGPHVARGPRVGHHCYMVLKDLRKRTILNLARFFAFYIHAMSYPIIFRTYSMTMIMKI
jgi:hypothetical protein